VNPGQFRILHGDSIGVAVFVVLDFESCGLRQFGQGCERFVHHCVEILVDDLDALEEHLVDELLDRTGSIPVGLSAVLDEVERQPEVSLRGGQVLSGRLGLRLDRLQ